MALWRRFGGAQPPTDSRGKHYKANMFTQKRAHAAPPTPFPVASSLRLPSGSPQRNAQARSEPTKSDNRTAIENALPAISTHGGIETQPPASRPVWRHAANSRRDRTQDIPREPHDRRRSSARDIPIETYDRHRTNTRRRARTSKRARTERKTFQQNHPRPAGQPPRAPTPLPVCIRQAVTFRRPAIHYPMKPPHTPPRQR